LEHELCVIDMSLAQRVRHDVDDDKKQSNENCTPPEAHRNSFSGFFTHFWFSFILKFWGAGGNLDH
jgi:hypothetical protein